MIQFEVYNILCSKLCDPFKADIEIQTVRLFAFAYLIPSRQNKQKNHVQLTRITSVIDSYTVKLHYDQIFRKIGSLGRLFLC